LHFSEIQNRAIAADKHRRPPRPSKRARHASAEITAALQPGPLEERMPAREVQLDRPASRGLRNGERVAREAQLEPRRAPCAEARNKARLRFARHRRLRKNDDQRS